MTYNYLQSLHCLRELQVVYLLFLIDVEKAEYNAIRVEYPDATIIICQWHVFEAVEAHVHKGGLIEDDKAWEEFRDKFRSVIDAKTCDKLKLMWKAFHNKWKWLSPESLEYLVNTWLYKGQKQCLCRAFFPKAIHFELLATSL